jgi:CubicO group peptidase (beta-lactamase class C family)
MGGIVLVLSDNKVKEQVPFGLADHRRRIPAHDSTLFRVASISKMVTATAVMQLYEQGMCSLDEDISNILGFEISNPDFPEQPITIRMLLSHTSSLVDGPTYGDFLSATHSRGTIPNIREVLAPGGSLYTKEQFLKHQPGSYFQYANINYGLLGTIVEKLSGVRFDRYCRRNILEPLSIAGDFNVREIPDINNVAVLYRKKDGEWTPQADDYGGKRPEQEDLSGYTPGTNAVGFSPQGGLRISGYDLSKILFMLMNRGTWQGRQILKKSTLKQMLKKQWLYNGSNGDNYHGLFQSWGLGIHRITGTPGQDVILSNSENMYGHSGLAYGLVSNAYFDPDREVGLIFITNGKAEDYTVSGESAFYEVEQAVFEAVDEYLEED